MKPIDIRVPDIGDFKDVEVIEVWITAGQPVGAEEPLITLETDKATMEVPAPEAGVITEVVVSVGDTVSKDSVIALLQRDVATDGGAAASSDNAAERPEHTARAEPTATEADHDYDVLVLGAGPGGYSAAFRAADLGLNVAIVERYPTLGGVCLNVGCIPSKALLHVGAASEQAAELARCGLSFGSPQLDLERLRGWKSDVVGKLTDGLAGMAKTRRVAVEMGSGRFVDDHHLELDANRPDAPAAEGDKKIIRFAQCIIAAGSQAMHLPFLPDDPRVVDSTGALALTHVPDRMLVIGGGIIGLEMATVYSALGARIDVVETLDRLMPGADRDLVKVWKTRNAHRFDRIMLGTKAASADARQSGIYIVFDGPDAPEQPQRYDMVLQSVGRQPNGAALEADRAGVHVSDRGFIPVDSQMRTNVPHIFAVGDIVGEPMLAHKAVHEAHVAAEAASGAPVHFDARVIPSVAYTDPEIAWVGITETDAKAAGQHIGIARFPWAAAGRAIANGRDEGFTKLLFDPDTGRILGGGIVGTGAGDLIGEIALAIEMGADAQDIRKTIHPHPTLNETIGMAAELYSGVCTDLPPDRPPSLQNQDRTHG